MTRLLLVDGADEPGRTTASLVASLAARLGALRLMTGSDAVASLTAGYAALGRRAARGADGRRLRDAVSASRVGANGDALWDALGIREQASATALTPVLDQLRNDLALLAADDLADVLELLPLPPLHAADPAAGDDGLPPAFADYLVGMWAYAREVVAVIEALLGPTLAPRGEVVGGGGAGGAELPSGPLLR